MPDLSQAKAPRYQRSETQATEAEIRAEVEELFACVADGHLDVAQAATCILALVLRERERAVSDWIVVEKRIAIDGVERK